MPELKYYGIFVAPLHLVRMRGHSLTNERGTLVVRLEDQTVVAEFNTWLGWCQEEPEEKKPGTVLTMVKGDSPGAA